MGGLPGLGALGGFGILRLFFEFVVVLDDFVYVFGFVGLLDFDCLWYLVVLDDFGIFWCFDVFGYMLFWCLGILVAVVDFSYLSVWFGLQFVVLGLFDCAVLFVLMRVWWVGISWNLMI